MRKGSFRNHVRVFVPPILAPVYTPFRVYVRHIGRGHTVEFSWFRLYAPPFLLWCLHCFRKKDSALPYVVDREVEVCILTN